MEPEAGPWLSAGMSEGEGFAENKVRSARTQK